MKAFLSVYILYNEGAQIQASCEAWIKLPNGFMHEQLQMQLSAAIGVHRTRVAASEPARTAPDREVYVTQTVVEPHTPARLNIKQNCCL